MVFMVGRIGSVAADVIVAAGGIVELRLQRAFCQAEAERPVTSDKDRGTRGPRIDACQHLNLQGDQWLPALAVFDQDSTVRMRELDRATAGFGERIDGGAGVAIGRTVRWKIVPS